MKTIKQWVGGEYYEGSPLGAIPVENPATGEIIAELLQASQEDLNHTVEVARQAQNKWASYSLAKRVAIMFRMRQLVLDNQDEMARLIVEEHGKNYSDAIGEIQRGRETLDFATAINVALKGEYSHDVSTGVDIHTTRQPVGVVAGVCPFNFPAMVPMWMHPLAIATGNAFILKPASPTPSASLLTAELYKEAGLPDGVFNVLSGDRRSVQDILIHPGIDAISFVGSTPVAHIVQDTGVSRGKRVQALGGANNHAIVMPDCDLDFAAEHISASAFGAAGERCMALPVVVAVGAVVRNWLRRSSSMPRPSRSVRAWVRVSRWGPSSLPGPRLVSSTSSMTPRSVGRRSSLMAADSLFPATRTGTSLGRQSLTTSHSMPPVYTEEVFGPVLAVVHADTYDEALKIVNAQPFGNGSAIFTNDGGIARRFTLDVEAGMVGVNVPIPTPVAFYSFGGWKESLLGDTHIHGPEGVNFYTRAKAITERWLTEKTYAATMSFQREE